MANLSQLLEQPTRDAVVADLAAFAEDTIASQSGLTGMALKGTVAAAKKVDGAVVAKGIGKLLPDILGDLQPYWQDFEASGQTDFGAFLQPRAQDVTDSIMAVADRNAESINVAALSKAYSSLRGKAAKFVTPVVPELGRIIAAHM
ncbi:hypothetical protein G7Y31_00050 [Corynebacterium lizhenjunii]|uniref:Uncharacterized protein n=1 Tax=Corynebacterium lizhenjunii TaxID=2709394 RepID=A0A7T0KG81_9CORY|nr:hypothetical protein [Corynebacterium lizhenjunii]QPK79173.1 hypothetical protein G7Y31_00050 [Corynebacterium lizhenjunii]